MRLILEENHDLPIVQLLCAWMGGSSADTDGRDGLADAAAELLLRGANGRDRAAFDDAVERLGASLHAETEADYTRLVGRVLVRNLDPFLALVGDALHRPAFSAKELDRLKQEMHADLDDLRDDDRSLAARYHARAVYGGSPYGRPGDGTHVSIDRITLDDCVAFARQHLAPPDAIVGIAGDTDSPLAERKAGELFGNGRTVLPPHSNGEGAPRGGKRLVVVDKPDRTQVQLLLGHRALSIASPEALPFQVGLMAFGGMFSSPLMQEVRVKRGWSYGAQAYLEPRRGAGAVTVHLFPANAQAPDALRLVLDLVEKLVSEGIDADLVERAKRHLVGSFAMDMDTPEKRLSRRLALDVFGLPADYLDTYRQRIGAIDLETVRVALRRYLNPGALTVTAVATASRSLDALAKAGGFARVERYDFEEF